MAVRTLQRKLQQLEQEVYQRQMERFLDGHRIDKARISGIGHARQITRRSYGLETAADITKSAVLSVPGFGPTYTSKLLAGQIEGELLLRDVFLRVNWQEIRCSIGDAECWLLM